MTNLKHGVIILGREGVGQMITRGGEGLNMIMLYLNDTLLKNIFNVLVYTNCSEQTGYILLLLYLLHKICGQVFYRGDTNDFRLREVLDNKPGKVHH